MINDLSYTKHTLTLHQTMWERKGRISMNQILESAYFEDPEKWNEFAFENGSLELCDDETGYPVGILKPNGFINYYGVDYYQI